MSKKALGRGLSALFTQMNPIETDLVELNINQIDPNEDQPRQNFREDRLAELAQSIKTSGIIQPIIVRRHGERFQIIAGERRWRAAHLAGLVKIPCIIRDIPDSNILELSLIENIQREELNPIEEAKAYKKLLDRLHITQDEIAQRVGKDRSTVTNMMRLLKLPIEIQEMVEEEKLSMGHARALLALDSTEKQLALAKEILSNNLPVRETERLVKGEPSSPVRIERPVSSPDLAAERANITAAEMKLSKKLAAPVKIRLQPNGGVIEIKFTTSQDLTRLFDLLYSSSTFSE